MNLQQLVSLRSGGAGSGPTAPCPQCGPKKVDTGFGKWHAEHAARLAQAEELPKWDRLLRDKKEKGFVPRQRDYIQRRLLLNVIKDKLYGNRTWASLTQGESNQIISAYNVRREKFGVQQNLAPGQEQMVEQTRLLRESKVPEQEPAYSTVTPESIQEYLVAPGTRIAEYQHRIPTVAKSTGKTWTMREHPNKGTFFKEAESRDKREGRTTTLISSNRPQGGTSVHVDQYSKLLGAPHNHVVVRETDHDEYGNRWRTRSREFTQPSAALRHIQNRYGVKL